MAKDSSSYEYPEFDIPPGFELPEGVATGDEFETVATFKVKEDGSMCITKVMGMPLATLEDSADDNIEGASDARSFEEALDARVQGNY